MSTKEESFCEGNEYKLENEKTQLHNNNKLSIMKNEMAETETVPLAQENPPNIDDDTVPFNMEAENLDDDTQFQNDDYKDILESIRSGATDQLLEEAESLLAQFSPDRRTNSNGAISEVHSDVNNGIQSINNNVEANNEPFVIQSSLALNNFHSSPEFHAAEQLLNSLRNEEINLTNDSPVNDEICNVSNVEQENDHNQNEQQHQQTPQQSQQNNNQQQAPQQQDQQTTQRQTRQIQQRLVSIAGGSQNNSNRHSLDDSVMIIDEENLPTPRRVSASNSDDEVIFVEERLPVHRITAIVDLCASPDADNLESSRKRKHSTEVSERNKTITATVIATPSVTVSCPVCMEGISDGPPMSTTCGHIFCGKCIKKAIQTRKKCPMCNTKLTQKQIHPIYLPV